jgi:signal peptidase I
MSETTTRPIRNFILQWLLRPARHLLALFGLVTLVYFTCFDLSAVSYFSTRQSRKGTFGAADGDYLLTERITCWCRSPRRWEPITCRRDNGQVAVRRVVGLPGETIGIRKSGQPVVDGQPVDRPPELASLDYLPVCNVHQGKEVACGDGYFVLGDDSMDVQDSRFEPPVPADALVGRPWLLFHRNSRISRLIRYLDL